MPLNLKTFVDSPALLLLNLEMTSLLAIAVHFLVLTQVTSLEQTCYLDLSQNFFDDQYDGCIGQMGEKAPQLLKKELEADSTFKSTWERAEKNWKKRENIIKNKMKNAAKLNDAQGTAVIAYTEKVFGQTFSSAVRNFTNNERNFSFYAFHYYLTTALQILHESKVYTVYRGLNFSCQYPGSGNVRLGQHSSSSLSQEVALKYMSSPSQGTLLTIQTSLGINITEFSMDKDEKEVLIPGYEEYQKITPLSQNNKNYKEFLLENPKKSKSIFNCWYIKNSSGMRESSMFLLLLLGLLMLQLISAEL